GQLIAVRAFIGLGAAVIFPATLSIISNVFTGRAERAKAIGLWGAMTGLGVAAGPICGGWLLERFWWGSVFLALVPVAAIVAALVAWVVPTSRDPHAPRFDCGGLVLSTAAIGTLVYTIIEAPDAGWSSVRSVVGFATAAVLLAVFVWWERRTWAPMLDVRLFENLRFSAASGSVTVAFFALFGFIFMVTLYFQFLKAYSPWEPGSGILPVAVPWAFAAVMGRSLAVRVGNRAVVSTGLGSIAIAFLWVSTASAATPYVELAGQMILLGTGLGLTSAPATEAIMGVVPKEKAGIGSALHDTTRGPGGSLGVAVIGSVFASLYAAGLALPAGLPPRGAQAARESVGGAFIAARRIADAGLGPLAAQLRATASAAFFDGFAAGCLVAAGVAAAGAIAAAILLPAQPIVAHDEPSPDAAAMNEGAATPAVDGVDSTSSTPAVATKTTHRLARAQRSMRDPAQ